MNKAALRLKHLDRRQKTDPVLIKAASFVIQEKLWKKINDAHTIGIYISMAHEVQTHQTIDRALKAGKIVVVPKIVDRKMIFVRLTTLDECLKSRYGILEPVSDEPYPGPIDIQVVPMLAFNGRKFRLGYGKGYYDAYLKDFTGFKLGICFQGDFDDELNESQTDIACDEILTEAEVTFFHTNGPHH
jgi:5-formyltetrahydrofolate cyclo-ligase